MPTNAQIKANRKNAKKSTEPRTEEGKTSSAKNALKHVLLARDTVMPGEDPAEFDRQLSALEADIQPANSLEFELVRQIADSQWRMRRLTRLETGFIAAAVTDKRRLTEKYHPERLRPGYDGETQLLGSAMLDRTQVLVHLARYDGHLSRRFFRAVKQLADLRRDEREAREARSSPGSYAPADPYRGRYVPAQAPPPIDTPSPTTGRIGFRVSSESASQPGLTQTTKQTQFPRTPVKSASFKGEPRSADLAFEIRGLCSAPCRIGSTSPSGDASPHRAGNQHSRYVKESDSFVAHTLSVPRRDSSRRLGAVQTTKQTQFRPTPVKSAPFKDEPRSADLAFEIRGLSAPPPTDNASLSRAASRRPDGLRWDAMRLPVEGRACRSSVFRTILKEMKPLSAASVSRKTLPFVSRWYVTLVAVVLVRTICVVLVLGVLWPETSLANSLRANSDSQMIQNERADRDKLSRLEDQEMLQRFARLRLLVSVPANARGYYLHGVPARLHYLRPWSKLFLDRLSNQFRARFGKRLRITSLIRTAEYQKSLGRRNSNAASAFGEKRSTHLTGASLDVSKKGMTRAQRQWLRRVLTSLKRRGYLFAVEEFQQPNFHIMVYRNYPEYVKQIVTRQKSRKKKSSG